MAELSFVIEANFDEVIEGRKRVAELEAQLRSLGSEASPQVIEQLEKQLASANNELKRTLEATATSRARFDDMYDALEMVGAENGTLTEKMSALTNAINVNQRAIINSTERLAQYKQEQQDAFNNGDRDAFNQQAQNIQRTTENIADLITETQKYQQTLDMMQANTGVVQATPVQSNMLFDGEKSYNQAKALREEITQLQTSLAELQTKGGDTAQQEAMLNQRLNESITELRGLETSATNAASRLGADLGGKAAEASAKLYELNTAIKEQNNVVADLKTQVSAASQALQEAQKSNDTSKVIEAQNNYNNLSQRLQNATNQLANLTAAQHDAQTSFAQINGEINRHDSLLVKMLGGQEQYNIVMSKMPPMVKMGTDSIIGMTGAAKAFIATPLGLVLGAIILAVQTLKTWFDSSAEGQRAFAEVSGYVSGVLLTLKEIVIAVGKALYTAFTDPKKAATELWHVIKTNLVNRFKAIGGIIKSVGDLLEAAFSMDGKKAGKAFKDIQDYAIQAATGVEHLTDKVHNYVNKVNDAGKAMAKLALREKDLSKKRSEYQIKEAEYNKKISEARLKMNKAVNDAERKRYAQQAQALVKQKYSEQIANAKEEYAIIKERNAIHTTTAQDMDKERKALAAITQLETRQNQEQSMFARRESSISRKESKAAETAAKKQKQEQEKRIQAQQKAFDELVKIKEDNEKIETQIEKDSSAKRLRQTDLEFQKRKDAIIKRARELAETNKKAGLTQGATATDDGLTEDQRKEIDKYLELNSQLWEKQRNDIAVSDALAMQEYLKEYGTFQEKKLAIAKIYADKIAHAQNEGERKTLTAERDKAIRGVDSQALQQQIDWVSVFGNMNGMMQVQIKELLNQLRQYSKTDEFRKLDPTEQKTITEAIERLRGEQIGGEGTLNLAEIQRKMNLLGETINQLRTAEQNLIFADSQLEDAQKAYDEAMRTGTTEQKKHAKEQLDIAKAQREGAQTEVDNLKATANEIGTSVKESTQDTVDGLNDVSSGLQGLTSGSLKGAYEGLRNMADGLSKIKDLPDGVKKAVGKLGEKLGSAGTIGAVISAILSILDILKQGIGTIIASLIDTIFQAVNGIIKNIITGKFAEQIVTSLVQGVRSILNTITFGGLNSWLDTSNGKQIQRAIDRLTEKNEILAKALERKTAALNDSKGGADSLNKYKEAVESQKEIQDNYLQIARLQGDYHGAHHSFNSYWHGFTTEQNEQIKRKIGEDWDGDLWSLTPDQMADILGIPSIVQALKTAGEGGYGSRVYDRLKDYADQAGKLDELTKTLNEKLTGMTFDGLYSSFVSSLMDMDKSAQDFANDFQKYMMQAVLNAKIQEILEEDIDAFYKEWAIRAKDGLDTNDMIYLSDKWQKITNAGLKARNEVSQITGYTGNGTSRQSASSLEYQGLSQDMGTEISGRLTAVQMTQQEQADSVLNISDTMATLAQGQTEIRDIADDTRTILANSFLELQGIRENTEAVVKPIKDMSNILNDIKLNGVKVK